MSTGFHCSTGVLVALVTSWTASGQTYTISTFAGGGLPVNIPGTSAQFISPPQDVAVDASGNVFFPYEQTVLRLDATTGILALAAGNGTPGAGGDNGPATSIPLEGPRGIALDAAGNLFILDSATIRKVSNGVITGGGPGGECCTTLNGPAYASRIAADSAGNLYISEPEVASVYKISLATGALTSVAGVGIQTSYGLDTPQGLAVDAAGNLYIADAGNNRIQEVSNGAITTVAGNGTSGFSGDGGPATSAQLNNPFGVAVDAAGNLYIADSANNRIREVSNGVITTLAGTGTAGFGGDNGPAASAQLNNPVALGVDKAGNVYIADEGNLRIRRVSNGVITTVAGNGMEQLGDNGPATSAQLVNPFAVTLDSSGNLFIADSRIRKVSGGVITGVAGNGVPGFSGDNGPATDAQLHQPLGVAVDSGGNVYIADTQNNRIRKVSGGVITTVAGNGLQGYGGDNGPATSAQLNDPDGVAVDSAGNLYIADTGNNRIRQVTNGVITTIAGGGTGGSGTTGDGGPATSASLNFPNGVALDSAGNLYIADTGEYRVREVSGGVITTVAGTGLAGFTGDGGPAVNARVTPLAVALDSAGNMYISDGANNERIRKVSNGIINTIASGDPNGSFGDNGPALLTQFGPEGVAADSAGNVYVADRANRRIRILTPGTLPAINAGGVVPNDSTISAIQSGSWISIFGTNLAPGTFLWNANFPTSLGGVSVNIDNKPAYLWFVNPYQINLQVPDDSTTGTVSVAVTTPSGTATSTVTLAPYGPSFSLLGNGKHVAGEIATPGGNGAYANGTYDLAGPSNTFSYSTRPVKPGETLTLYGVGLGPTTPRVPAGHVFSGSAPTSMPVTITIGGVNANVVYSGITEAGLYQVNLIVPPNTGSGDQPLQATVNGVKTPTGPVVTIQ